MRILSDIHRCNKYLKFMTKKLTQSPKHEKFTQIILFLAINMPLIEVLPKSTPSTYRLNFAYAGLIMDQESLDNHAVNMMKVLAGGLKNTNLVLKQGGGRFNLHTLKINRADRELFVSLDAKLISPKLAQGTYLVHLKFIKNHAYGQSAAFFDEAYLQNYIKTHREPMLASVYSPEQLLNWYNQQSRQKDRSQELATTESEWLPVFNFNRTLFTLTQEQAKLLDIDIVLPYVLSGPGGAGKTLMLLASMVHYIENLPVPVESDKKIRILYLTLGDDLLKQTQSSWRKTPHSAAEKGVEVDFTAYLDLCTMRLNADPERAVWQLAPAKTFYNWFKVFHGDQQKHVSVRLDEKIKNKRKRPQNQPISQEQIEDVFEALQWLALRASQPSLIIGQRLTLFPELSDQQYLQDVLVQYNEYLSSLKLVQPEWYLFKPVNDDEKYDLLLIDEGEALSAIQIKNAMGQVKNNQRITATDSRQDTERLFPNRPWLIEEERRLSGRKDVHFILPVTKRCSAPVVDTLNKFLRVTDWVTGGYTDKFEYSYISEESNRDGDVLFFTGSNAIEKWKERFANLQDRSQVVILTREQDVQLAKTRFDTANVTTVTRFRGLERSIVVLFNLFSSDVYAEINKLSASMPKDLSKKFGRVRDMGNNRLYGRACRIIITALKRALGTVCIVQNEADSHRFNHILNLIKPEPKANLQITAQEPILTPEEKLAKWELTVNELIDSGLVEEAQAIYEHELAKVRGPWTFSQAPASTETSKPSTTSTATVANQKNTPVKNAKSIVPIYDEKGWSQLISGSDRREAFNILFKSAKPDYGCALEALLCTSHPSSIAFIKAVKNNDSFARALTQVLQKNFQNGITSVKIKETGLTVNLSPAKILESQQGVGLIWHLQSKTALPLSNNWLSGHYPGLFEKLVEMAPFDNNAAQWLIYALNNAPKCKNQAEKINLGKVVSEKSLFEHLLVTASGRELLVNLLHDAAHNHLTVAAIRDFFLKEVDGHQICWQLLLVNKENHAVFAECIHFLPRLAAQLLKISPENRNPVLKHLFTSTAGLICINHLYLQEGSAGKRLIYSLPLEHWMLKNENNVSALQIATSYEGLHLLLKDYFSYSAVSIATMLHSTTRLKLRDLIISNNFTDFVDSIYDYLPVEQRPAFIHNLLELITHDLNNPKFNNYQEWVSLLTTLITEYQDEAGSYQIDTQPIIHWLLINNKEALLSKIIDQSQGNFAWIFETKDHYNRAAYDIAFQLNRKHFLVALVNSKGACAELFKQHGKHARQALLTWLNLHKMISIEALKVKENQENYVGLFLSRCFLDKPFLYHILRTVVTYNNFKTHLQDKNLALIILSIMKKVMGILHQKESSLLSLMSSANSKRAFELMGLFRNINAANQPRGRLFTTEEEAIFITDAGYHIKSLDNCPGAIAQLCEEIPASGMKGLFVGYEKNAEILTTVLMNIARHFSQDDEQRIFLALLVIETEALQLQDFYENATNINLADELNALKPDFLTQLLSNQTTVFYQLMLSTAGRAIYRDLLIHNPALAATICSREFLCKSQNNQFSALQQLAAQPEAHNLLQQLFQQYPSLVNELTTDDLYEMSLFPPKPEEEPCDSSLVSQLLPTLPGRQLLLKWVTSCPSLNLFPKETYLKGLLPGYGCRVVDFLINHCRMSRLILREICTHQKQLLQLLSWKNLNINLRFNGNWVNSLRSLLQDQAGFECFLSLITHNPDFNQQVTWENLSKPLAGDVLNYSALHYIALNYPTTPSNGWPGFLSEIINRGSQLDSEEGITTLKNTYIGRESLWESMLQTDSGRLLASGFENAIEVDLSGLRLD